MALTKKENILAIEGTSKPTDYIRTVTTEGKSKRTLRGVILDPVENDLSITGATPLALDATGKNNFLITLTANSVIFLNNLVAGLTGYITVVQDGGTKHTLSYSGNAHGDTIAEPEIGEIDVHSFVISAIGAASAPEPIFGSKTNI
jgi:expansin (peptidoglycan-binding protein)